MQVSAEKSHSFIGEICPWFGVAGCSREWKMETRSAAEAKLSRGLECVDLDQGSFEAFPGKG